MYVNNITHHLEPLFAYLEHKGFFFSEECNYCTLHMLHLTGFSSVADGLLLMGVMRPR